jgi:2'-5' RNA ligase
MAIPSPQSEKLARFQQQLASEIPEVRWTASPPYHLTLAFLGDVPDRDLSVVCQTVGDATAPFSVFDMHLEGVGAFPSLGRPRVIWAGLGTDDDSPLFALQKAIVTALTRIGYRPDDKRFAPHVTLGRIRQDRRSRPPLDLTARLGPFLNWSGGRFQVSEVVTFSSTLSPEGPKYAPLARAPLTGKKTPPQS